MKILINLHNLQNRTLSDIARRSRPSNQLRVAMGHLLIELLLCNDIPTEREGAEELASFKQREQYMSA